MVVTEIRIRCQMVQETLAQYIQYYRLRVDGLQVAHFLQLSRNNDAESF